MAIYYDMLDFRRDNFEVIPRHEWRILGRGRAKKPIKFVRFCRPNCEYFRLDSDKKPICVYGCKDYIFERHVVDVGEVMVNLLFAVNTLDKHEGIAIWIGEEYLQKNFGESFVNKMLKEYKDLMDAPEQDISRFTEETTDDPQS